MVVTAGMQSRGGPRGLLVFGAWMCRVRVMVRLSLPRLIPTSGRPATSSTSNSSYGRYSRKQQANVLIFENNKSYNKIGNKKSKFTIKIFHAPKIMKKGRQLSGENSIMK